MARKHKAAVRLSRVDGERVEKGDLASPEDALHQALTEETGDANARNAGASGPGHSTGVEPRDAHERQLLENLPPHFGKI